MERPAKRTKLLSDDESDGNSSDSSGGALLLNSTSAGFKINEDFARRFEHNSRRAELHRLENKLGSKGAKAGDADDDDAEASSSSEDEDDDGVLAQGALDAQYMAALAAIRNKDPRVYDGKTTFYTGSDGEGEQQPKTQKPMFLNDYHRENLLSGQAESDEEVEPTYAQQQEDLKRAVTREMHDAADPDSDEEEGDGFLVTKPRTTAKAHTAPVPSLTAAEIEQADAAPEEFLTKFLDSKAWVQPPTSAPHPFESDDEEEDARADAIEEAYNLRFEDPEKANETLKSHARDVAAKYSVRKEPSTKRKRARDVAHDQKEAEKQERAQDRARLRRLRIEEAQEKLERIKEAAGGQPGSIDVSEWQDFLTEDWDDARWEQEMRTRFDDKYYAADSDAGSDGESSRKKPRKPKWDDDIDIGDLVPEYDSAGEKRFTLSEEEAEEAGKNASKKSKQERAESKAESRKQQRRIEQLVDEKLELEAAMDGVASGSRGGFRYRETSPAHFGMTARDILMASDGQLNQFAGLKKMAAFRDEEKKKRDRKKLGKKARLRKWRKETFGNERGPQQTLQDLLRKELDGTGATEGTGSNGVEVRAGKRKRSTKTT